MTTQAAIRPFTMHVPDAIIEDLRARLSNARYGAAIGGAGPECGLDPAALRELCERWGTFDVRGAEREINTFPAFETTIDGTRIHFVHARGEGGRRAPIVLTNGWPSCFTELLPLVPLLTAEVDGLSFDVVIPSLPGYGFSERPRTSGLNITTIASMWAVLMARLGYETFFAHGSDMGQGQGVAERLRALHPSRVAGIHMVNVLWAYPCPADASPEERDYARRGAEWRATEGAYAMLHATKPSTIAAALSASPVALAAWIGEKVRSWTDSGGELGKGISWDALCTLLTIYWATETIGSSQWLYREAFSDAGAMSPPAKQGPPVGISIFPKDILPAPRAWGERWFDVARWSEHARGGHFPGFEAPELLANDVRAFVRAIGT
jgi:pimeloyl-ACP methyl ester carboxylesterase